MLSSSGERAGNDAPGSGLNAEKLSLLLEVSRSFSTLTELDALLPRIIARIKDVFEAESCAILLFDEERDELYFPMASEASSSTEDRLKEIRFPADRGIAGWVVKQGRPALVQDVARDERFYPEVDRLTGLPTRDLLYVPLRATHRITGALGLRNKLGGAFTDEDLTVLEAFAGPIAIAVENARLYQSVRSSEARLKVEVTALQRVVGSRRAYEEIVGTAPAMARVFQLMESAISSPITVLVEGETGTGKELIARAIHANGPRKDKPFIAVNCAALPETLLQSELFGHKKGAFTGAVNDAPGLFEVANEGTLFLDEIGETTPVLQQHLLRALQEGEIRRVGETQVRRVDVRVISASNRDLAEEVRRHRFREDLYYRISVFPLRVPALRERREDVPLLSAHFVRESNARLNKQVTGIAPEALALLSRYSWPGNVRELRNEIERGVALAPDGGAITAEFLSEKVVSQPSVHVTFAPAPGSLRLARGAFEREYLTEALRRNQGNAAKTAKLLGLSRQMLQRKIKEYGLRAT
jgi:Nif-specific regulatory protein